MFHSCKRFLDYFLIPFGWGWESLATQTVLFFFLIHSSSLLTHKMNSGELIGQRLEHCWSRLCSVFPIRGKKKSLKTRGGDERSSQDETPLHTMMHLKWWNASCNFSGRQKAINFIEILQFYYSRLRKNSSRFFHLANFVWRRRTRFWVMTSQQISERSIEILAGSRTCVDSQIWISAAVWLPPVQFHSNERNFTSDRWHWQLKCVASLNLNYLATSNFHYFFFQKCTRENFKFQISITALLQLPSEFVHIHIYFFVSLEHPKRLKLDENFIVSRREKKKHKN